MEGIATDYEAPGDHIIFVSKHFAGLLLKKKIVQRGKGSVLLTFCPYRPHRNFTQY